MEDHFAGHCTSRPAPHEAAPTPLLQPLPRARALPPPRPVCLSPTARRQPPRRRSTLETAPSRRCCAHHVVAERCRYPAVGAGVRREEPPSRPACCTPGDDTAAAAAITATTVTLGMPTSSHWGKGPLEPIQGRGLCGRIGRKCRHTLCSAARSKRQSPPKRPQPGRPSAGRGQGCGSPARVCRRDRSPGSLAIGGK